MRVPVFVALLLCAARAEPPAPAWELGPSDFLRYERRSVTTKDGKEKFGAGAIVTVHGHDLRGGQYAPVAPGRGELPALLGLRLPPGGTLKLKLKGVVALRVKARLAASALDDETAAVVGEWTFASRGKEERRDTHRIRKGSAHVYATFDRKHQRFRGARVELAYVFEKLDPKRGEKPQRVARTWDLRFKLHRPARQAELRREVDQAIANGVKHLRSLQQEDGSFEPHGKWDVGSTALAVLTLCACEVPRTDPAVARALAWLVQKTPQKTYDRAVCLMALEKAYTPAAELRIVPGDRRAPAPRVLPPDHRAWGRRIAQALESSSAAPGSWGYPTSTRLVGPHVDSSNTQYAVLGLRAAARLGLPVKDETWLGVVRHFQLHRERKGPRGSVALVREGEAVPVEGDRERSRVPVREVLGFRYKSNQPHGWGSMTSAGIASLRIAVHQLQRQGKSSPRLEKEVEEMILGAWAWLEKHAAMDRNPHKAHGGMWYYYYLYSLERAAILDRVKRLGGRNWYFEGAVQLLARQSKKGSWDEPGKGTITETCFALLFLKRATAPLTQGR